MEKDLGTTKTLRCIVCGADYPVGPLFFGCPRCRKQGLSSPLDLHVETGGQVPHGFRAAWEQKAAHNIWRYADMLPAVDHPLSLDEGGSPLTLVRGLSEELGIRLYVKNESVNPTWSFKDRYAAVAVAVARQLGYGKVVCASTGNFGQAVAAYCSLHGLRCLVLCPPTASELLRRVIRIHGAEVVTMPKGDRAPLIHRLVTEHGWYPITFADPAPVANPFGLAGYKTIGYEMIGQLGEVPDSVLVPVGGGDCLYSTWRGISELRAFGLIDRVPRMVGCQVRAAAPLVNAVERNLPAIEAVSEGESSAISILEGRCGLHALQSVRASSGTAVAVEEHEVRAAIQLMARHGIFLEASSATSVAGALVMHRRRYFPAGARVICVVTSAGVKWPDAVAELADPGPYVDEPSLEAVARIVDL